MKKVLLFAVVLSVLHAQGQTALKNAVIKAKSETRSEGDGDAGGGATFRIGGQESEIALYIKDSMSKSYEENGFMRSIRISNNASGKVISLTETNGEKTGYYTMAADREDQKRRMDSTTKAREQTPSPMGGVVVRMSGGRKVTKLEYVEESKEINKIKCKKAIAYYNNAEGAEEKFDLWYTPDYILPAGLSVGSRGFNFGDLKGLPIQYETINKISFGGNEMQMISTYTVSEISVDVKIEDKEFEIPKGYKVKTYAEFIKDNPGGSPAPQIRTMIRG